MKKFSVIILFEGKKEVMVEARNENEAEEIVDKMIDDEKVIFSYRDMDEIEITGEEIK